MVWFMELTLDQALQKGIQAHKTGQLQEADRLYTAILKIQPKHPDANHNLGLLAVGVGNVEAALPFFNTALNSNPYVSQYWLSFIEALIKLDRIDDAKAAFDQANKNSAKGEAFNLLERRLRELSQSDDSSSSDKKIHLNQKLIFLILKALIKH